MLTVEGSKELNSRRERRRARNIDV